MNRRLKRRIVKEQASYPKEETFMEALLAAVAMMVLVVVISTILAMLESMVHG